MGSLFGRAFGVFGESENGASVAGEKSNVKEKEVLGAGENICRQNYLWILLLISQLLFSFTLLIKRYEKKLKLSLTAHSILFGVTVLSIYLLSCFLWPILISIVIFIVPTFYLLYEYRHNLKFFEKGV